MAITATERVLLNCCAGDAGGIDQSNWLDVLLLGDRHEVTPLIISTILSQPKVADSRLGEDVVTLLTELRAATVIQHRLTLSEDGHCRGPPSGESSLSLSRGRRLRNGATYPAPAYAGISTSRCTRVSMKWLGTDS